MTVCRWFLVLSLLAVLATFALAKFWPNAYSLFGIILPLIALGIYDMVQRKHTILRLYPVVGRLRYLFESIQRSSSILSNPTPTVRPSKML